MESKNNVIDNIVQKLNTISNLYVVGSYKRGEENVNDLDYISTIKLLKLFDYIKLLFPDLKIINFGKKYMSLMINGIKVDIWHTSSESKGWTTLMRTVSKEENIYLRKRAKELGLKLNEYGLFSSDGAKIKLKNLKELYKFLGV